MVKQHNSDFQEYKIKGKFLLSIFIQKIANTYNEIEHLKPTIV